MSTRQPPTKKLKRILNSKKYECIDEVKEKLSQFGEKDITITTHAEIRAIQRQISTKEVIKNLLKPVRLK